MTIIVGIIVKDGLVIASDSQAGSFRGVEVKRLDYTKIYDVSVEGAPIVITGAGEAPFITRAIELFEEKTREAKFHQPRELADVAEAVMTELNRRYVVERSRDLGYAKGPATSPTSRLQDERGLGFALMMGTACHGQFCIYTVYPNGVAERGEKYASLGSGSPFAEYLLARLYRDDLTLDEAIRVAVYVIEEVKKVDLHCGGPTRVVAIAGAGVVRKNDTEVQTLVKELEQADAAVVGFWRLISSPEALQRMMASRGEKKQAAAVPPGVTPQVVSPGPSSQASSQSSRRDS